MVDRIASNRYVFNNEYESIDIMVNKTCPRTSHGTENMKQVGTHFIVYKTLSREVNRSKS